MGLIEWDDEWDEDECKKRIIHSQAHDWHWVATVPIEFKLPQDVSAESEQGQALKPIMDSLARLEPKQPSLQKLQKKAPSVARLKKDEFDAEKALEASEED